MAASALAGAARATALAATQLRGNRSYRVNTKLSLPSRSSQFQPALSIIMQYFKHSNTLSLLTERLLTHSLTELIIHADSNTDDDKRTFEQVLRVHHTHRLSIVHSENVHELRGYNRAAVYAKAPLILFTQDDALPPSKPLWVDYLLTAFAMKGGAQVDAMGLLAGKHCSGTIPGRQVCRKIGQCGFADTAAEQAFQYVDVLVMGPIAVRTDAFFSLGGFNESYSKVGKPGMGFEGAWSSHLWDSGYKVAVSCASPHLTFANGCGGRGTLMSEEQRRDRTSAALRSHTLWRSEFPKGLGGVRSRIEEAQRALMSDPALVEQLRYDLSAPAGCVLAKSACSSMRVVRAETVSGCATG